MQHYSHYFEYRLFAVHQETFKFSYIQSQKKIHALISGL